MTVENQHQQTVELHYRGRDYLVSLDPEQPATGEAENAPQPPVFSELALALRFVERHEDDLRYVAAWNKWLIRDGRCWTIDETNQVLDFARAVCREASAECDTKIANRIASHGTIAAVLRLARADRKLVATARRTGRRGLTT